MELYLLLISAIGGSVPAVTGLLNHRVRYGLPLIQARLKVYGSEDPNEEPDPVTAQRIEAQGRRPAARRTPGPQGLDFFLLCFAPED